MPAHTHAFSGTTSGMSANATGYFKCGRSIYADGASSSGNVTITRASNGSDGSYGFTWGDIAGRYNSTVSINVSHTHTYSGTANSTGNGGAHENMPPYVVKYCWERTA